jgi:hypothetical protein
MKRIGLFAFVLGFAAFAICDSADARHHHRRGRRGCGGCGSGHYDVGYISAVQKGGYNSPVQNDKGSPIQKGDYGNPSPSDGRSPGPPAPPPPAPQAS